MAVQILIAHPSQDIADLLKETLEETLQDHDNVVVDLVRDRRDATSHLSTHARFPYNLVIAHLGLPEHRRATRDDRAWEGIKLLESLEQHHPLVPTILVTPCSEIEIYRRIKNIKGLTCELISEDGLQVANVASCAVSLIINNPLPEKRIRVVLRLCPNENERLFGYSFEGVGFPLSKPGPLTIDEDVLKDIVEDSKQLGKIDDYSEWESFLERIGKRLSREIFGNPKFNSQFSELIGEYKNAEICFDINRPIHPAILEALTQHYIGASPTRPNQKFWMLQAPVYRRLRNEAGGGRYPLFHPNESDQSAINSLIIESQVDGIAPEIRDEKNRNGVSFRPLPNVPIEAAWLEEYLNANKGRFGLGRIERINLQKSSPQSLLERLNQLLTTDNTEWHLIHYAGHCHYDTEGRKGFLVFPGQRHLETLELKTFSSWVRHARFVYLSGCRSSEEDFVYELANNFIPAVFGFRWKVDDDIAPDFTKSFYQNLFEKTGSLEYAFMHARREMRKMYQSRRIWAAPILILQFSSDSQVQRSRYRSPLEGYLDPSNRSLIVSSGTRIGRRFNG